MTRAYTQKSPRINNPDKLKCNVLKLASHEPLLRFLGEVNGGGLHVTDAHRATNPIVKWIEAHAEELFRDGHTTVGVIKEGTGMNGPGQHTVLMQALELLRGLGVVSSFKGGEGKEGYHDNLLVRFHRPYKARPRVTACPVRIDGKLSAAIYDAVMALSDGSEGAKYYASRAANAAIRALNR